MTGIEILSESKVNVNVKWNGTWTGLNYSRCIASSEILRRMDFGNGKMGTLRKSRGSDGGAKMRMIYDCESG